MDISKITAVQGFIKILCFSSPYYGEGMDNIPDSSQSEKWLDPDHFIYKGKVWVITRDFQVKELR